MEIKINKWDFIKLKSICNAKEIINKMKRQSSEWEKTANWQKINLQNIQATHAFQYQKNKQPNQKLGRRPTQTFLQRRQIDGQHTQEKMLNVTHYSGNAD